MVKRFMNRSSRNLILIILGAGITAIVLVLPLFTGPYFQTVMISLFFWAYVGIAWNIVGGYAGQISLGHAAFLGTGIYVSAIFYVFLGVSPWISIVIGSVFALGLGIATGYLSFQFGIRGPYFILVSLAFAEIVRIIFVNIPSIGGSQGLPIPLEEPSFWKFQFVEKAPFYYLFFILMVLGLFVNWLIVRSKLGYFFVSIRENEDAAATLGVNPLKYKIIALSISAVMTSVGGTVWAQYLMYAEPGYAFGVITSIEIALRPIIGGMGTLFGPVVGSIFMTPLGEFIRLFIGGSISGVQLMVYGIILVGVVLLLPNGLIVPLEKLFQKLFGTQSS
jgi:branched-chain amino acid transport system permease protein